MKAERTFIETEDDGKINWSPNGNGIIAVVNKDKKNKYGEYPGWRIAPGEFLLLESAMDANSL
jgi:primary-amine oxidase